MTEAVEVSERTIRDDIAFLRDRFSAPLEFDRTLGWHYTEPDWRLPSIPLSQGELPIELVAMVQEEITAMKKNYNKESPNE